MMEIGKIGVIKRFFDLDPAGKPLKLADFKALTAEDKTEMADEAIGLLGGTKLSDGKYQMPD